MACDNYLTKFRHYRNATQAKCQEVWEEEVLYFGRQAMFQVSCLKN